MKNYLYRPIDAAILIYFRIFTGILIALELMNHLGNGKFQNYFLPKFHFSYLFSDWIHPWPLWGMELHYALTILAGFAVAFNFFYRFFSVVLFLGVTGLFLMDSSHYVNHHYLYCLMSFCLMVLPLDKNRSTQPAWMLYLLLFHMGLAYFFAGVAKLNSDWLSGTPMDLFLAHRGEYALGLLYRRPWAPILFSWAGLCFDLLIVPLMLWKKSRFFGLILSAAFHLSNVLMFGLATFPWFSLLMTSMFFDPSWPRKIPVLKNFMPGSKVNFEFPRRRPLEFFLGCYVVIHLCLPFRHLLYPGVTNWTEEGHMFSWRMMLRDKQGDVHFFVQHHDKKMSLVDPLKFITQKQYDSMVGKPDLILQFAHFLRDEFKVHTVFASSRVSLNGRPKFEMIEPGTNLAKERRHLGPYSWVRDLASAETLTRPANLKIVTSED